MKISIEWLKEKDACFAGMKCYEANGKPNTVENCIKKLMPEHFDYANWLLTNAFTKEQNVKYAIFAAKQVVDIFEKEYPNDKRPRHSIEAAEEWLKNPCEETQEKAAEAAEAAEASEMMAWGAWVAWGAWAARTAAWAAWAARTGARATAESAEAARTAAWAAKAARTAAWAARTGARATAEAARTAAEAAEAAWVAKAARVAIINYGVSIL